MRDLPRRPRTFNLIHTPKLIGIARVPKGEGTGSRSGNQGKGGDQEGVSNRKGSKTGVRGIVGVVRIRVMTIC